MQREDATENDKMMAAMVRIALDATSIPCQKRAFKNIASQATKKPEGYKSQVP